MQEKDNTGTSSPDNMRILVAEDNEFYQKVIQHQLKTLGYSADVTGNGRSALKNWRTGKYALLLTDIHMPKMSGHELANRIRKAEQHTGHHIPIIAFTASCQEPREQDCMETGIDAFIKKPIDMDDLQQALKKWLSKSDVPLREQKDNNLHLQVGREGGKLETHGVEDAPILVDSTHIKKLIEQLGQDGFNDLLSALLKDTRPRLNELREAIEHNDSKAIHDYAHALASGFGFMGLNALYRHTRALSEASQSGPVDDAHDRVATIETVYTQTVSLLRMDYNT